MQSADDDAAEYARHATYQEKKACRGVAAVQLSQCRADAKAEYSQKRADSRREYDDLVAQQTSALWTGIMGIAALTGMVLSVIGIFLVYTTFRETKLANIIARQVASASAADAKRARDALIAADRAIITIDQILQNGPDGDWTTIFVTVQNKGKSNAYGFQILFSLSPDAVYRAKARFSHNIDQICADGSSLTFPVKIRTPRTFPMYIVGFVSYSTMGDANFRSHFCFRINGAVYQDEAGHMVHVRLEQADCADLPALT